MALVYTTDAGGGGVSHREKRLGTAANLSPQAGARRGASARLLPRAGSLAHARAMDAKQGAGHMRPAADQAGRDHQERRRRAAGQTRRRANRTPLARHLHARARHGPVARPLGSATA